MEWGGRREGGSGRGTRVHPWRMHVDVWQNQYNIVKLKKKFNLFGISGWCVDLYYCCVEWFVLDMNRDLSVTFEIALKCCISDSFVDYEGYYISSKGFLPTVVDTMVI